VYKAGEDAKTCLKLCNFGLAVELGNYGIYDLCGTPTYMAPEVINGTG